jgi:hypothetical protein
VQDAGGQTVGCFISANSEETARQAKVLTRDGARRMAVNCARLPELLGRTIAIDRHSRLIGSAVPSRRAASLEQQ